jgi:hypothetical protein
LLWPADHPTQWHPTPSVRRIHCGNESHTAKRPSPWQPRPGRATDQEHPSPPHTRTVSRPPTKFDLLFGGPAREEDGDQPWGDSWGHCRPNTPPPIDTDTRSRIAPAPVAVPGGLDMAALISTLLKAQADAQLAQTNANHANLIAFQTATAQALAAKGGDKESKLTTAKKRILQACAGVACRRVYDRAGISGYGCGRGGIGGILRKRFR